MNRENLFHVGVNESHLTFILGVFKRWGHGCLQDGTIQAFACDGSDKLFNGIKLKTLSSDFDVEALFYGLTNNAGELSSFTVSYGVDIICNCLLSQITTVKRNEWI